MSLIGLVLTLVVVGVLLWLLNNYVGGWPAAAQNVPAPILTHGSGEGAMLWTVV